MTDHVRPRIATVGAATETGLRTGNTRPRVSGPSRDQRRDERRSVRCRCRRSPTPATTTNGHTNAGVVYLNNRHHDPTLGTFISVDPLVTVTGEAYAYASADPINGSDPSGLICNSIRYDRGICGSVYSAPKEGPTSQPSLESDMASGSSLGPASTQLDPCAQFGCISAGPARESDWHFPTESYRFGAASPMHGETLHGPCKPQSCDVAVVVTYLGGDLAGGGRVFLEGWSPETQAFLFLTGGAPLGEPSQAFFFRRNPEAKSSDRTLFVEAARGGALSAILSKNAFTAIGPTKDGIPQFSVYFAYNNGSEAVGWNGALPVQLWAPVSPNLLEAR